mmetsp:Transcript_67367/g.127374  ORF Transcript_67367/g.127374 Transcript_67367/m.127374 type:complete len:253 (-) Transcript_67367:972-1730(-)
MIPTRPHGDGNREERYGKGHDGDQVEFVDGCWKNDDVKEQALARQRRRRANSAGELALASARSPPPPHPPLHLLHDHLPRAPPQHLQRLPRPLHDHLPHAPLLHLLPYAPPLALLLLLHRFRSRPLPLRCSPSRSRQQYHALHRKHLGLLSHHPSQILHQMPRHPDASKWRMSSRLASILEVLYWCTSHNCRTCRINLVDQAGTLRRDTSKIGNTNYCWWCSTCLAYCPTKASSCPCHVCRNLHHTLLVNSA